MNKIYYILIFLLIILLLFKFVIKYDFFESNNNIMTVKYIIDLNNTKKNIRFNNLEDDVRDEILQKYNLYNSDILKEFNNESEKYNLINS